MFSKSVEVGLVKAGKSCFAISSVVPLFSATLIHIWSALEQAVPMGPVSVYESNCDLVYRIEHTSARKARQALTKFVAEVGLILKK